jgi:hypothetical protein
LQHASRPSGTLTRCCALSCQNSLGKGGNSARDSTGMRKKWVLLIIRIVATARKWAVAYVTAALPVEVALNDRNSRRRCGMPRQLTAGRNSALDLSE